MPRATPLPGSTIRVSATAEGEQAILRVADEGKGVPERERERVFERFVRLDENREIPGSGLGLSIARSLVELNGGRLRLANAPGGGALFEIVLPRVSVLSRVLLADDEAAIRKVVRDALEREGHEVVTAADGQEALDAFEAGEFDLVVSDLAMPRMDGHSLVAEVRRRSAVPILVLTVRDEEREKVRLLDAGRGRLRDEALRRLGARRARARPAAPDGRIPGTRARPLGRHRGRSGGPRRSARAASPCT